MTQHLSIWTIYDHPTDYPGYFVARRFEYDRMTGDIVLSSSLETLRARLARRGLVCLTRDPSDDPKIVETWL